MENSQKLINTIQKKDKISRYILILLLILNLVVVWAAVSYVLNRVSKFERTIDCKLLIIPEDRTKAKFIKCGDLNNESFSEIINGEEKPSFKEVDDDSKNNSISLPSAIQPLPRIIIDEPSSTINQPDESTPIRDTVNNVTNQVKKTISADNPNQVQVETDIYWQVVEDSCQLTNTCP